jgi:ketosteroid isomerase-like protein
VAGGARDQPSSAGGQNNARYAFFAAKQRLAVDAGGGSVRVYDSVDHRISSAQQAQSGAGGTLMFTSQHGEVDLAALEPA